MSRRFFCLSWYGDLVWTTAKGDLVVDVLADVTPQPVTREVHKKQAGGTWSVTKEPGEELAVYVDQVRRDRKKLHLDGYSTAERLSLYEAVRAEHRKHLVTRAAGSVS
jgi:hypothetical protein